MARWPIDEQHVDALRLDPRNVRIPGGEYDDSAIANYMVEAADLLDLARDILRDGYIDNEVPVVVREDDEWVVLEGNRRVTALKAIQDPLILGKSEPRMRRLLSRFPEHDAPSDIRVMIAPSREAALPLLARLHTRSPKKSWLREQQAIFYHAQLSSTVSVDDLRTIYPAEASAIASFIRMGEMRNLIRGLRYDDPALESFVKTSQLKMTSFEYAYDLPRIQGALGLSFNKDGLLERKRLSAGQRRGLMHLLARFTSKPVLNTRSPELRATTEEHARLVEVLEQIVASGGRVASKSGRATNGESGGGSANEKAAASAGSSGSSGSPSGQQSGASGSSVGSATGGSLQSGSGSTSSSSSGSASRGPNRGETRNKLNMDGFSYKGSSGGLRRRFEELRTIDVKILPNATYDLLRTVLECAIKDYFATKGQQIPPGKMLGYCITELVKEFQADRRMTALINSINRSGKMPASQFSGTATALNASNHEPDLVVSAPEVHEAWDRMKPILVEIVGK